MFDGQLMLRVNWPVVDTIHPQSNKFATGVNIKATGEYKLNYSPEGGKGKLPNIRLQNTRPIKYLTSKTAPVVPQSRCNAVPTVLQSDSR